MSKIWFFRDSFSTLRIQDYGESLYEFRYYTGYEYQILGFSIFSNEDDFILWRLKYNVEISDIENFILYKEPNSKTFFDYKYEQLKEVV